ncbi:hypothetical protein BDC45DRAFT_535652 [Circinella umbellata]|nr:hypothetical protein BDC45DRAFT_535652 [Circinella umbellata]
MTKKRQCFLFYEYDLRTDEKTAEIEGIQYYAALSFDNDENELSSKEKQEIKEVDEVIKADDPYHIVMTELGLGKNRIHSFVSFTRTANNSEKHFKIPEKFDGAVEPQASSIPQRLEILLNNVQGCSSQQPVKQKRGRPRKSLKKEVQKPRGSYKKHTNDFSIKLIDTVQNVTLNCTEAARMLRMPVNALHKIILHVFKIVNNICLVKEIKKKTIVREIKNHDQRK